MAVVNGLQAATGTQLENLINKCECVLGKRCHGYYYYYLATS